MPDPSILTIPVNYNDDERTIGFLKQLAAQQGALTQHVLVVDNSEPPRTPSPLKEYSRDRKGLSLLVPPKNLGYYGGAAFGLNHFLQSAPLPDWVVVSNTDLSFPTSDFLAQLCQRHGAGPFDVIAPSIVSSLTGRDQNPFMKSRPSRFRMHAYKWIFRIPLLYRLFEVLSSLRTAARRLRKPPPASLSDTAPIYAPQGSLVLFRKSWFEAGGSLAHGAFLYGEEITVAETARNLNLRIGYDPALRVIHDEHATTRHSRRRAQHSAQAARHIADTYFSRSAR